MGPPEGNQNARKGKEFLDALRRALADDDWKALKDGCKKVAQAFEAGEPWAVHLVADRLDGKPAQTIGLEPETVDALLVGDRQQMLLELARGIGLVLHRATQPKAIEHHE